MIGVFDSGIGGLSVLSAIRKKMPEADIIYFGDTENAPYGNKSAREIGELISMALRRLAKEGATDIVSACNSASVSVHSLPLDLLRIHKFNIVEMVGPTVETLAKGNKKIALVGTLATIHSGIYQQAFKERGITITTIPIPPLAGLIEKGASQEEMQQVIDVSVQEALASGAEIISLSCTHFPFVRDLFELALKINGSDAYIFDPAESVASEVASRFSKEGTGTLRLLVSKKSPVFEQHAAKLFGPSLTVEEAGSIYWALKAV
jgi:glutamate racemase